MVQTTNKNNLPAVQETWIDPWVRKVPWRREWSPTPVFLPGEFHGQRSLAGYSPWGCRKLDTAERLTFTFTSWPLILTGICSVILKLLIHNTYEILLDIGVCDLQSKLLPNIFKGFPCGSAGKESTCNAGDLGSIPGLRRSPGEEKGYPLQYSGLCHRVKQD